MEIEKKFLEQNESFALEFKEGFMFGRVVRRRKCTYKPWPLIDSDGAVVDIDAVSTQAELRFRDPRNPANSILYLSSTTNSGLAWFYHGAFGIKPQHVNMYLRYPEGDIIPGKFAGIDPIRPAAGDNISPINDLNSPYEQPTDFIEVVIQPQVEIGAEYYNRDEKRNHQPVLNILFCQYWIQVFKPHLHPTQIADIAMKRYEGARAKFLKAGFGDIPHDMGPQIMDDWKVKPMTLDEAGALGGR